MQFNGRLLEVPDNDIIYYDSLGNFRKLNPIKTYRGYYGFKPDDKDLFEEVVDGTFKCWYNKKHCRIEDGCIKFDKKFIYRIKNYKMREEVYLNIFDVDEFKKIKPIIKIDELTILIKSFMRPECVNKLIKSIRRIYDIKIVIVDDSKTPLNFDYDDDIKTYNMEFDSGLSAGRNYGVSKIETPYFLLCDDDFEFTEKTDLIKWLEIFKSSNLDILGGDVIMNGKKIDYFGLLEKVDDNLYYKKGFHNETEFYKEYDLVLNFFIAKTDSIIDNGWDNDLKLAEHTAFFFDNKGKLKVGHTELISIDHQRVVNAVYSKFRNRNQKFFEIWMRKREINRIFGFNGLVSFKIN